MSAMAGFTQAMGSGIAGQSLISGGKKAKWKLKDYYDESQEYLSPYREEGGWGLEQLRGLLEDPESFRKDPSYDFQLQEGLRGIEGKTGAQGLNLSGETLRGLTKYSGDLAAQQYQNRLQNLYGLSQLGLQAAGQSGTQALSMGQLAGGAERYIGEARAAQIMGVSSGLSSMMGGGGGMMGGGGGGGGASGGGMFGSVAGG